MIPTPPHITPEPTTPAAPAWMLYMYGTHAYFTFGGRLIAQATVATPAQEATITGIFEHLTTRTASRSTQR